MKIFYEYLRLKLKSIRLVLFFLILLSFSSARTYATIRYVKQTALGLGNGISWANASNNLQAMIEASSANDEVWVMSGTYKPISYPVASGGISPRDYAFVMRDKIKVYGGFVGTETSLSQRTRSIMVANPSILSGDVGVVGDNSDNAYHVVISVEDDNTTILDGFTITKGNANNDDLFKAILVEFRPINPNSGGGLYNYISSMDVRNCNFIDNKSSYNGGGMYNLRSFTTISNCIFSGNEAKYGGGTTNIGGELSISQPNSVYFSNCLFTNNSANQGGGLYNDSRNVNLTNCSFVNNNSTIDGGGIYVIFFSVTTLNNCIVWGNKKFGGTESNLTQGKDGIFLISYSDIEGGYSGTQNINQNPLFINSNDPDGNDNIFATSDDGLSIQSSSPCINAGKFRGNLPTDITGFTRFANSDMGTYENRINMTSVSIGALPSRISCAGQDITFAAVATIEGETRLYDFKVNGITKQRGASLLYAVNNLSNGDSVKVEKVFGDLTFVSNTIVVTIKPAPVPNAGSNSPVCVGNSLNLNASGGGSYLWTGPNNYSSTLQNPSFENATNQLSGIYTVNVTNDGCEAISNVQVAVNTQTSRLFVKANATGANNGTSWVNAFTDLQSAFDYGCYNEIWVAAGTYKPSKDPFGNPNPTNPRDKTFYLRNSKILYGGFAGNETSLMQRTQAVIDANPTILSGDIGVVRDNNDNAYHVLISVGFGHGTALDGFTITRGNANSSHDYVIEVNGKSIHGNTGGGMVNIESSPAILNCIFRENSTSWEGGGVYNMKGVRIFTNCIFFKNNALSGGGMNNARSSPDIIACKFIENYAVYGGGLLNYDSSSPRILHCLFSGNSAGIAGGIYNQVSSSPQITNCTFFSNSASDGGGMYNVSASSPTITNCSFSKNAAEMGGGMMNDIASPTIRNCTFYGNSASYYNGGGIYNLTNGTVIVNSIFWGNKKGFASISKSSIEGDPANITYSNIEGGYTGIGNINQDPLFVNQNDLDGVDNIFGTSDDGLELRDGSPCINSGAFLDYPYIPDITGAYRAQQGAFDMGAYESPFAFNQCQTLTWQQGGVTTCDGKATFTIKVNGLVGNTIAQFSIDKINWFDATSNGNTYIFTVPQQGICRGFYARPKGCSDASKIIWCCYLDTYSGYPVSCEPCSSDLIWIQGGVITCNGKAKMTIKVLGLKANTVAEFSTDQVNWFDATADGNTYTFTVPQQGICRSFWARPKGCNNPAKVIWGCYLDTYAGYPVICTDGQIPSASQAQSLRTTNYTNEFSTSEIEIMSVETMPNPVNDNLTVKIYLPKNTPLKITLISNIGREMDTKSFEGKSGENLLTIDMKYYTSGMYLLWVQSEEARIIKKVIKIE